MDQTFFLYKPIDRKNLHELLFSIVWFANGRISLTELYNLPIPIRRLYERNIQKIITQSKAEEPRTSKVSKFSL